MNKSESKYFNTAIRMDQALLELLEMQEFSYISVKNICEKAGVNRSTFYLHYENTTELLAEALQYLMDTFLECFDSNTESTIEKIKNAPKEELIFVTEEYLIPYLSFIKKNRRIYKAAFENQAFESEKKYKSLYKYILEPILERFHYDKKEQRFVAKFYICGINGIIEEWMKTDCVEDIEEIGQLIMKMVIRK